MCHFFSNNICVRFMFLINMLNWICRVDTRGWKRVSQEDWRNGMENEQKDERIRLIVSCFHLFIVLLIIQSKPLQWEFKNIAIIIILLMILSLFLVLLSPCHKTTHFKHWIDFITKCHSSWPAFRRFASN